MAERSVALSVLGFLDVPAPDFVDLAAAAGFDAVSLRVTGSVDRCPAEPRSADEVAETRRRLDAADLGVIDVEVLRLGPDLPAEAIVRAVDSAALLGARHLLTVDAGWGSPDALAAQLEEVRRLADQANVRTCLEFMPFSRCRDLESAIAAARAAGAGVLVDVLHLFRSGGDVVRLVDAFTLHGAGLFPYVQLCDAPAEAPGADALREEAVTGRQLPGQGGLPLADVLAALPGDLPLAVEAPTLRLRSMPPADRALATMRAAREFLDRHPTGSGAIAGRVAGRKG